MAGKIYVDDTPRIELDLLTDLSTSTVQNILYKKPDGTEGTWTADIEYTKLYYQSVAGDIDQAGKWLLQAYVELPFWTGKSETVFMIISEDWK